MIKKILAAKSVLITRAKENSLHLFTELEDNGAEVIYFPTISIVPKILNESSKNILSDLSEYDYIIFTSVNSCDIFMRHSSISQIMTANLQIAAVGAATAQRCSEYGMKVNITPSVSSAKGLIKYFENIDISNSKILLPSSSISGDELPTALKNFGADLVEIELYDTICGTSVTYQHLIDTVKNNPPDIFVFTSPSSFSCFLKICGIESAPIFFDGKTICAIGNTTEEAIKESGVHVNIVPDTSSLRSIEEAVIKYFNTINNLV